jgi:hypothetical protein
MKVARISSWNWLYAYEVTRLRLESVSISVPAAASDEILAQALYMGIVFSVQVPSGYPGVISASFSWMFTSRDPPLADRPLGTLVSIEWPVNAREFIVLHTWRSVTKVEDAEGSDKDPSICGGGTPTAASETNSSNPESHCLFPNTLARRFEEMAFTSGRIRETFVWRRSS